ncbi:MULTISPECIES: tRNA pseudouridine(55) synthase TruB [Enterococcaceae]|uniref:tRNA pseudouridine(55) synthase TruB n=1 Tax=Enterococcaceae TaxID=81852 RepID=UPI000E5550AE|nr:MULTISPECIES: tRNA pseudouridine(55) synthase TruB [Enterococcaceae]MCI0130119.1 tRNA pseudouridine(55) synthase TruB [Vagococcus sp. CY53-2]RGI30978.1 tRNA pseudouridine(55) synthase TruB [Melissococcus sp. OM08-11BH]UNM88939.1 tRNA pseudouridine(55) synthase TruB [Vagococcus sp. CY52-2]
MEGIIPLWKPRGMTSHDCVFQLRKILKTKKVGHSGTLDPDVDGILPICVGKATKVVEYLQESNKLYVGEITLGFSTETEDASGEIVAKSPITKPLTEKEIDEAMLSFTGDIQQIPPMYSAVKVNGRRLYDYARKGESVDRPVRQTVIHRYKRISQPIFSEETQTQSWKFEVDCAKGTYVRTLAVDTGKKLGYEAHMSDLTRLSSGGFDVKEAITLERVRELVEDNQSSEIFYPLERAVETFPKKRLTPDEYQLIRNGLVMPDSFFEGYDDTPLIALFYNQQLVSLYGKHPSKPGLFKPVKVIRND